MDGKLYENNRFNSPQEKIFYKKFSRIVDYYTCHNMDNLYDFVWKNSKLLNVLHEVKPLLKNQFPNANFELKVVNDSEIKIFTQLLLIVKSDFSKYSPEEKNSMWKRIVDDFTYIKRKYNVSTLIFIDLDDLNE